MILGLAPSLPGQEFDPANCADPVCPPSPPNDWKGYFTSPFWVSCVDTTNPTITHNCYIIPTYAFRLNCSGKCEIALVRMRIIGNCPCGFAVLYQATMAQIIDDMWIGKGPSGCGPAPSEPCFDVVRMITAACWKSTVITPPDAISISPEDCLNEACCRSSWRYCRGVGAWPLSVEPWSSDACNTTWYSYPPPLWLPQTCYPLCAYVEYMLGAAGRGDQGGRAISATEQIQRHPVAVEDLPAGIRRYASTDDLPPLTRLGITR